MGARADKSQTVIGGAAQCYEKNLLFKKKWSKTQ